MPAPDLLGALVAYMRANADVAAEVGVRVSAPELPSPVSAPSVPKSLVLRRAGYGIDGYAATYVPVSTTRIDARCYGPTPEAADAVYRAVNRAFKSMRRTLQGNCLLYDAVPASGGSSLRDPDTKWPFVLASFNVTAAEDAAP